MQYLPYLSASSIPIRISKPCFIEAFSIPLIVTEAFSTRCMTALIRTNGFVFPLIIKGSDSSYKINEFPYTEY